MHKNNFDFLRLIFALFVIITHSYALTGVSEENDLLIYLTNGSLSFSTLGVGGFFIISGYLITESMKRSRSIGDYFTKRILRIYPGLAVVLLVTVSVGLVVTTLHPLEYIKNGFAISYLLNNLGMVNIQHTIQGVFENNPYPNAVNGSLWTIQYELLFYTLLSFLFFFRLNKNVLIGFLLVTCSFGLSVHLLYTGKYFSFYSAYLVPHTTFTLWGLMHCGLYFASGALLSAIEINTYRKRKYIFIVALLLTVGTMAGGCFAGKACYLLLPPLVIILGLHATKGLAVINYKVGGDLSYGIYLYGFLIQQMLMHYFDLSAYELMILTIPISMVIGYLSWNYIEKYPLQLKNKLKRTPAHLNTIQNKVGTLLR